MHFLDLMPYYKIFLNGLYTTVELTLFSTFFGILVAVAFAAARQYGKRPVRIAVTSYVELIRNTPFIVQLFFIFFGLPAIGLKMNAWEAGFLAMVINLSAYSTEIIRAGLAATPKSQIEAAKVLGLNPQQRFFKVVFIPALEKIYPALTSQCIIVMLGSAAVSQISVTDLTYAANLVQSRNFRGFESYLVTAAFYLMLSFLMRKFFLLLGARLFRYRSES